MSKLPGLPVRIDPAHRRANDPTTCDFDFSDAEREFADAMGYYKRHFGRPFPTWHEVMEVLHHLGYRKVGPVLTGEEIRSAIRSMPCEAAWRATAPPPLPEPTAAALAEPLPSPRTVPEPTAEAVSHARRDQQRRKPVTPPRKPTRPLRRGDKMHCILCGRERLVNDRTGHGLCPTCYNRGYGRVRRGTQTWEEFLAGEELA